MKRISVRQRIEVNLKSLDALKEKIDKKYAKLVWDEIKPYTNNKKSIRKAYEILNSAYMTPNARWV